MDNTEPTPMQEIPPEPTVTPSPEEVAKLLGDARMAVQSIAEILQDLDDCLRRLRENAVAATVMSEYTRVAAEQRATAAELAVDQRFPYLAGRQPRRDGDSYGTVAEPVNQGGTYYGTTQQIDERLRRRAENQEPQDGPDSRGSV